MATSTFQNLRAGLVTAITSQLSTDAVTDVTVTEYPPLGDDWTREDRIWFASINWEQQPYTQGASGFRQETLTVEGRIWCPRFGRDEQGGGEQRAETLFASVENCLRGDITVGGVVFNVELAAAESNPDHVDESGPIGYIEFDVEAEAHI